MEELDFSLRISLPRVSLVERRLKDSEFDVP
jgi:hypothetical protein